MTTELLTINQAVDYIDAVTNGAVYLPTQNQLVSICEDNLVAKQDANWPKESSKN
jgi:hypothetical protein